MPPTLTQEQAKAQGYRRITFGYLPKEDWILRNAIRQLGRIPHVLVPDAWLNPEIWRK